MKNRYFIHPKAYWHVIDFIETYCTYADGEDENGSLVGRPIKLPTWMKWELRTIYGRYDSVTHRRAVREAYIEVPKKNSKSMLVSTLSIYHLLADGYFNKDGDWIGTSVSGVYCSASTKDQAKIVFNSSKMMVKQHPDLLSRVRPMQYSLDIRDKIGSFRVLASEAEAMEGLKSNFTIIDELHVCTQIMYDTLKGAGMSNLQPLIFSITTAGVHDPTSIAWSLHEYAVKIQDDWKLDPSFYGKIYAAPQDLTDKQCLNEKWAKMANPMYGSSVKPEIIKDLATRAKNDPARLNQYKRYHLNIWVSSHSQWILKSLYKKCKSDTDFDQFLGKRAWLGVDLARTEDLTAVARLYHTGKKTVKDKKGVSREMDTFAAQIDHFCTSNKIDAVANNSSFITYQQWVNNGWIEIAGDSDTDYFRIGERIDEIIQTYTVRNINFDRSQAWAIAGAIEQKHIGKGPDFIRAFNWNSFTASPPMKHLQFLVNNGLIDLGQDPVLEWQFDNVMVEMNAKLNIFPNKLKAKNGGKIDGVVALILAVDGWLHDPHKGIDKIMEFTTLNG